MKRLTRHDPNSLGEHVHQAQKFPKFPGFINDIFDCRHHQLGPVCRNLIRANSRANLLLAFF
jgi:hypothetical protein